MPDSHGRYADDLTRDVPGWSLSEQPTDPVPPDTDDGEPAAGTAVPGPPPGIGADDERARPEGSRRSLRAVVEHGDRTEPPYSTDPVAIRRADPLAGLLLLLAGMAAGVSLLVVWVRSGDPGLDLVRAGVDDVRDGSLWSTGSWQPLAVVFGGAALFVLGLLMYVPARTHRFLGVLALLVSLGVAAGVLVPLADAGWDDARYEVGGWFTVAVGALGLLGALKALSTNPKLSRRR
jgi:hypothetical protein